MKWLRHFLRSEFSYRIFALLAATYIRLVFFTCKWSFQGKEIPDSYIRAKKPFILCFWHGRLCMLACSWTWKESPIRMLMSTHRDGLLITRTVGHFGIASIAGSTQRGGTGALRELIKTLREGKIVGITPDGPRGPSQIASIGVITLAKLTQTDMIPLTFSTSRGRLLNTWDRFLFPFPFGRGLFLWGDPISPPTSSDVPEMERTRQLLETTLTELQNKADELMGFEPNFEFGSLS